MQSSLAKTRVARKKAPQEYHKGLCYPPHYLTLRWHQWHENWKTSKNLQFEIFAHDVSLWTTHGYAEQQTTTLQEALATIENFLAVAGMKPAAEKTKLIVFGYSEKTGTQSTPP